MSEENVETVRRQNEAFNRRDLKAWMASYHRDAEIDWSRAEGPVNGVYRGHRELEGFCDAFWSTFDDVRGRQGIELVARSTFVFTVQNGQITRLRMARRKSKPSKPPGFGSRQTGS